MSRVNIDSPILLSCLNEEDYSRALRHRDVGKVRQFAQADKPMHINLSIRPKMHLKDSLCGLWPASCSFPTYNDFIASHHF